MKKRSKSSLRKPGKGRAFSALRHDFLVTAGACAFPAVFGILLFGVLLPGSTAALPEVSVFNLDYTHDQLKFRFFEERFLPFIVLSVILFSSVTGLLLFSFLNDKRKSAFTLSLGLKREKLFFVRVAAGFLTFLFSMGLPTLLSLVLNRIALGGYPRMAACGFQIGWMIILQALICLLAAAASCSLTGTLTEAAVLTATILAAPSGVLFTLNSLMKTFLWGNVYGETTYSLHPVSESLLAAVRSWNPLLFCISALEEYNSFSRSMEKSVPDPVRWKEAAAWTLTAAAAAIICMFLFKYRKAENAGISGLSRFFRAAVRIVWPVTAFGLVLEGLRNTGRTPAFLAACTASLLLYVAAEAFLKTGETSLLRRAEGAVALLLAIAACTWIVQAGMFGYTGRIPEASQVSSVQVSFPGLPALLTEPVSSVSSGKSYYSDTQVTLTDEESIGLVRELHENVIGDGWKECGAAKQFGDSVFPYDLHFTYYLKNGKTLERYYDRVRLDTLAEFLRIGGSEDLRKAESAVVQGSFSTVLWNSQAFAEGRIFCAGPDLRNIQEIQADENSRKTLLNALAEDLEDQSQEERYHPDRDAVGVLLFSLNGEQDVKTFRTGNSCARLDLNGSFRRTGALLQSWGTGFSMNESGGEDASDPTAIESITLQPFDPYSSMNRLRSPLSLLFQSYLSESGQDFLLEKDFGTRPVITDEKTVRELLPGLRSTYFMEDGGCLAAVKYRNASGYVYKFIPLNELPESLRAKLG